MSSNDSGTFDTTMESQVGYISSRPIMYPVQTRFVNETWNGLPEEKIREWKDEYLKVATSGSAGLDLRVIKFDKKAGLIHDKGNPDLYYLRPNETVKVHTGLAIWLNDPTIAGLILPRSGLGNKGIVLGNLVGLIDSDYQGELIVSLWNRSDEPIAVTQGERVAQYMVVPRIHLDHHIVEEFSEETQRGIGGFGSTGQY